MFLIRPIFRLMLSRELRSLFKPKNEEQKQWFLSNRQKGQTGNPKDDAEFICFDVNQDGKVTIKIH